jgi:hypothetical protein
MRRQKGQQAADAGLLRADQDGLKCLSLRGLAEGLIVPARSVAEHAPVYREVPPRSKPPIETVRIVVLLDPVPDGAPGTPRVKLGEQAAGDDERHVDEILARRAIERISRIRERR